MPCVCEWGGGGGYNKYNDVSSRNRFRTILRDYVTANTR